MLQDFQYLFHPRTVHKDILIAKLKPGQRIKLLAKVVKGIGKDHAKFQPVSTASYRILPVIKIDEEYFQGDKAKVLVERCPLKVFDIEDGHAIVSRPRDCTMCRECIVMKKTDPSDFDWDQRIKLLRDGNFFQFSVESVGAIPPETIVERAIQILDNKCLGILKEHGNNNSNNNS